MPMSRPIRDGDFLISIVNGGHRRARGNGYDIHAYVLGEDFGISRWTPDYIRLVNERIFGIENGGDGPAAITNRTAPGLYVREGDDTSNWEEYRQVLARRVAEATGGASRGVRGRNASVMIIDDIYLERHSGPGPIALLGHTSGSYTITAPTPQQPQPPPPPSPQPKPEPTRFSLLEVDLPAQPPKSAPKASTDLAELQASLRLEREQKRAQATAQAQMNRFDLLECDLPAVPVKAAEKVEVKNNKPISLPAPVTQIADLTKARDLIEKIAIMAQVNEEVATALWRRETN